VIRVGLALVLGLALGILLGVLAPAHGAMVQQVVTVMEPVGTIWINALRMTVIPLIIPLLIVGVAGGGSAARIGSLGVRALGVCFAMLCATAVITALVAPALLGLVPLDPASTATLRSGAHVTLPAAADLSFQSWLVSLVPANPIKAAADGALLPVVLFTLLYAFALVRQSEQTRASQIDLFRGISEAMLTVVRWVLALAPIGVFALTVVLGSRLGISAVTALGYYLLLTFVLHLAVGAVLYLVVASWGRVSIWRFARAVLPAQVVAFSSRSSLASLPALVEGARDTLQLPDEISSFVVPLLVSTYKLSAAINWTLGALFVGHLYGISLGPAQIAMFAAGSVILSTSVPGIPSGGLLIQAPLFVAAGLPVEGIGILIAIDTVPDMIKTAFNVTADLGVATILGRSPRNTPITGTAIDA
jgi:Na+/H+-dicarboxylate symporter